MFCCACKICGIKTWEKRSSINKMSVPMTESSVKFKQISKFNFEIIILIMNWRNDPRTSVQFKQLSHMRTWKFSSDFNDWNLLGAHETIAQLIKASSKCNFKSTLAPINKQVKYQQHELKHTGHRAATCLPHKLKLTKALLNCLSDGLAALLCL